MSDTSDFKIPSPFVRIQYNGTPQEFATLGRLESGDKVSVNWRDYLSLKDDDRFTAVAQEMEPTAREISRPTAEAVEAPPEVPLGSYAPNDELPEEETESDGVVGSYAPNRPMIPEPEDDDSDFHHNPGDYSPGEVPTPPAVPPTEEEDEEEEEDAPEETEGEGDLQTDANTKDDSEGEDEEEDEVVEVESLDKLTRPQLLAYVDQLREDGVEIPKFNKRSRSGTIIKLIEAAQVTSDEEE